MNKPVLDFMVKIGSDSACLSDTARGWVLIQEHFNELDAAALRRISNQPGGDLVTLQAIAVKRAYDGMKDILCLALLLDPRPNMVAFVRKKELLGSVDDKTLGNSETITAAKRAMVAMAEGIPFPGKSAAEVGKALCKALTIYLGVCDLPNLNDCFVPSTFIGA